VNQALAAWVQGWRRGFRAGRYVLIDRILYRRPFSRPRHPGRKNCAGREDERANHQGRKANSDVPKATSSETGGKHAFFIKGSIPYHRKGNTGAPENKRKTIVMIPIDR